MAYFVKFVKKSDFLIFGCHGNWSSAKNGLPLPLIVLFRILSTIQHCRTLIILDGVLQQPPLLGSLSLRQHASHPEIGLYFPESYIGLYVCMYFLVL